MQNSQDCKNNSNISSNFCRNGKFCLTFFFHLSVMLQKNYLNYIRNKRVLFSLLIFPYLSAVVILIIQFGAASLIQGKDLLPNIYEERAIPKCMVPEDCLSLGYAIIGHHEPWIDQVMEIIAENNNFINGKDIKLVSNGSVSNYSQYISTHENKSQAILVFCTDNWSLSNSNINMSLQIPCQFQKTTDRKLIFYSIAYNQSLTYINPYFNNPTASHKLDPISVRLKKNVDEAIIRVFKNVEPSSTNFLQPITLSNLVEDVFTLNVFSQGFPSTTVRFLQNLNIVFYGSLTYLIPHIVVFLVIVVDMLNEKDKKLKQTMMISGLNPLAYWASWFLTGVIIESYVSIAQILSSRAVGFDLFLNSPISAVFSIFFCSGMSIICFGFFLTSVCPDVKSGYTVAYTFILFSFVVNGITSQPMATYIFYIQNVSFSLLKTTVFFLEFYPGWEYAKMWGDIALKAAKHYDIYAGRFVDGYPITWSNLYEKMTKTSINGFKYNVPGIDHSFWRLFQITVIILFLTWYFDHIAENNRGAPKQWTFLFRISYWKNILGLSNKKNISQNLKINTSNSTDDSVIEEKERVMLEDFSEGNTKGLCVAGLTKSYHKTRFGQSKKVVNAIENIFLLAEEGELISILGHNGAGKTTLINALTGQINFDNGQAIIYGYDIEKDIEQIRNAIGLCPQFDINWDYLTLEEHLKIFCTIRNISQQKMNDEINQKLKYINLADKKIGGMKRRLSIAIASIGNPKIIFFDEPTSGLDPVTKQQILTLISDLKKNRVLILTTHSMEEAESLSDRIMVLADGKIRALGSSLYLKNKFGDGYRLSLQCDLNNTPIVKAYVNRFLPNGIIIDERGGSFIIGVATKYSAQIIHILQILEGKILEFMELKNIVNDWGISISTLEEVFMKITREASKEIQM